MCVCVWGGYITKRIVALIQFLVVLLLVYNEDTDLCVLIL